MSEEVVETREPSGKDMIHSTAKLHKTTSYFSLFFYLSLSPSLYVPAPSPTGTDSSGEDPQLRRRRRGLLRMYYGVENEKGKVRSSAGLHSSASVE